MGVRGRGRPAVSASASETAADSDSGSETAPGPEAESTLGRAVTEPAVEPVAGPAIARGRAERRRTARRAERRRRRSLLRELPMILVVALVIALLLKTFLVQVFVIPSGSMEQTIQIGDRVLVDKATPWFGAKPERGEVVVFKDPGGWLESERKPSSDGPVLHGVKQLFENVGLLPSENEQDLIKRVIGVAGDTVECCDATGRVSVNGKPLDEPYVALGNAPSRRPFKVTVPAGRLWVMGDHRDVSADSRFHMDRPGGGTVPVDNVIGRAFVIAWPMGRMRQLDVLASFSALPSSAGAAGPQVVGSSIGAGAGAEESVGVNPDPVEPPLVMGVLGVIPFLARPRRAAVRPGLPAG